MKRIVAVLAHGTGLACAPAWSHLKNGPGTRWPRETPVLGRFNLHHAT